MKLYFVETERAETELFSAAFAEHDLSFVDTLDEVAEDAEAICIFIYSKVDAAFLASHPKLQLVCTRSSTHDHVDLPACAARGVAVTYVPSYGKMTVAEHTFALILALSRRLREVMGVPYQKVFSYAGTRGFELNGKNLGVIGMGKIGQRVTELATAFGMRILAYDPHESPAALGVELGFQWVTLEQLLAESHVITLHVRLTEETRHLLNRDSLARCRPGVLIINTARGGLIDTTALHEALESGQVGGAGLDVLEDERVLRQNATHIIGEEIVRHLRSDLTAEQARQRQRLAVLKELMEGDQLLARSNVVFTPHVAFNSVEAVNRLNEITVENIAAFLKGAPVNLAV